MTMKAKGSRLVMSASDANKLRTELRDACKSHGDLCWTIGKLLWSMKYHVLSDGSPLWKQWGYKSIADYIENELGNAGARRKQLEAYVRIYRVFGVTHKVLEPLARELEYGKLREISRIGAKLDDPSTLKKWLNLCHNRSYKEVETTVTKANLLGLEDSPFEAFEANMADADAKRKAADASTFTPTTKEQTDLFNWAVKRGTQLSDKLDVSKEEAVARCLAHYKTLVEHTAKRKRAA